MRSVTVLEFRRKLGGVIDEVVRTGEPVAITRRNRPLVVLVSADRHEAEVGGRRHRLAAAAQRVAEWREKHAAGTADLDSAALVGRDPVGR